MSEAFALPPFQMHGARHVIDLAGGAIHIRQQVDALEEAVTRSPNLALDLARSLVESVCKTILNDLNIDAPAKFNDLLKETFAKILICPPGVSDRDKIEAAIQGLTTGLNDSIQGITDLRHAAGLSSHGRDGHAEPLSFIHASFAAQSADAIITFLYRTHRTHTGKPSRIMRYTDDPVLNEYIDDSNDLIKIFEATYKPSEALFYLDREAYRNALVEMAQQVATEIEQEELQQTELVGQNV